MEPGSDRNATSAGFARFYRTRRRVYTAMLVFVIAAGLPMATVPSLRTRLLGRVGALTAAIGGTSKPVVVQVGQNGGPLPAEFERPEPPPSPFGNIPTVTIQKTADGAIILSPPVPRATPRAAKPQADAPELARKKESINLPEPEPEPSEEADIGPKYSKGKIEEEAYALLLASNATVAGLVKGADPSLRFVSWDAAGRGEDLYWVRLKFQAQGKPEAEYIWQVKLESKQVTPLNYNARTIP